MLLVNLKDILLTILIVAVYRTCWKTRQAASKTNTQFMLLLSKLKIAQVKSIGLPDSQPMHSNGVVTTAEGCLYLERRFSNATITGVFLI